MQPIAVTTLRAGAVLPSRATAGSAGYDLYACLPAPVEIAPGQIVTIPTGIAMALPTQTVGLLFARSSLGVKYGVVPANCVGVIDSDYRGELLVGLINHGKAPYTVQPGERIAQLVVTPVLTPPLQQVDRLDETARNTGGFGSTGR